MGLKFGGFCLGLALMALLGGPAEAQIKLGAPDKPKLGSPGGGSPGGAGSQTVYSDYSLDNILSMAKTVGIEKAEIKENDKKEKYVSGEAHGLSTAVYREKCEGATCSVVSFYCYFGKQDSVDLKWINEYNRGYFAKLIQVGEGNITLEMNVLLFGGVTAEHIERLGKIFVASIKLAIDFKPS